GPVAPGSPWTPCGPVAPAGPVAPVAPVAPGGPVAPAGPVAPVAPVDPVAPGGPCIEPPLTQAVPSQIQSESSAVTMYASPCTFPVAGRAALVGNEPFIRIPVAVAPCGPV